jgi:MYXO-CTERM domain-containing protein
MRVWTIAVVMLGVLAAGSVVQADAVIEDWADTNDRWGDPISYNSARVTIDTANQVLNQYSSSSNDMTTSQYATYTPNVDDVSYWWDLSGNQYDRFTCTYKNTGTSDQTWIGGNSNIAFVFKRYATNDTAPNQVRWYLLGLIKDATGGTGTVAAGETVTLTGFFDDWDWRSRTDMYGWDTANDRYIIAAWGIRKDYNTQGAQSPFELGPIVFTGAPPPPAPIAEPGAVGLVLLGLTALRRRR